MKLLTNENFPWKSVELLIEKGFDVISIGKTFEGIKDSEVMNLAMKENRTILTFDSDYGELIYKHKYKPKAGVIYFRLQPNYPTEPAELFLSLCEGDKFIFENRNTVIDKSGIRQRIY